MSNSWSTSSQLDFVLTIGRRKTARNRQGKILYTELLKRRSTLGQFLANSPSHGKFPCNSPLATPEPHINTSQQPRFLKYVLFIYSFWGAKKPPLVRDMLGDEILYPFAWVVAFNIKSLCMAHAADRCGFVGQTPCTRSWHCKSQHPARCTKHFGENVSRLVSKIRFFWGRVGGALGEKGEGVDRALMT